MEKKLDNYGWFYKLLKRMPGADKETIVKQWTHGRTTHLGEMTLKEYEQMCRELERVAGCDERRKTLIAELKRARSSALHQMQLWGVDTTDWDRVNEFCMNQRISGKAFRELDCEELAGLTRKLRAMNRKKQNLVVE